VPRLDHAQHAQSHAFALRARLQHPIQHRRAVGHEAGQVGLEDDAHRAADRARALEREVEVGGDLAAGAVATHHVLRADRVLRAGQAVPDQGGDAIGVLRVAEVLGVEPDPGPSFLRRGDHDRLRDGLRRVEHGARTLQLVVRVPDRVRAPGGDATELLAGEAGAERRVAHQLPRRGLAHEAVLDAHVAHRLHRALVGDVRAGALRQPVVFRDEHRRDAVRRQEQRRGGAGWSGPDHEDVGLHLWLYGCRHRSPIGRVTGLPIT
jgi:hypothetical protein